MTLYDIFIAPFDDLLKKRTEIKVFEDRERRTLETLFDQLVALRDAAAYDLEQLKIYRQSGRSVNHNDYAYKAAVYNTCQRLLQTYIIKMGLDEDDEARINDIASELLNWLDNPEEEE